MIILQQVGHDFRLYLGGVALCVDGIEELYLQLQQFPAYCLVLHHLVNQLLLFRKNDGHGVAASHDPTHQGPLAYSLYQSLPIDMNQNAELGHVERVKQRQRHGRNHQLLVCGIDGRRQEHLFKCLCCGIRPVARRPEVIKQLAHALQVTGVQFLQMRLLLVGRLQTHHSHIAHIRLQFLTDVGHRPFPRLLCQRGIDR